MEIKDIKQQIAALEQAKEFHHEKYLNNLQIIDDKIDRIEKQLDRTKSQVKKELLKRSLDWYDEETIKMDEAIELRREREKDSFEYNIENIRKCCKNRSVATLFDALESVANALEIIRSERRQAESDQRNVQTP